MSPPQDQTPPKPGARHPFRRRFLRTSLGAVASVSALALAEPPARAPAERHAQRNRAGAPRLDAATHRLLIHGLTRQPLVLSLDDLKAMPAVTRTVFIECAGNARESWESGKTADGDLTVQNTHGLVSNSEWTGVPLLYLMDLAGVDRRATWLLAEGDDGAGLARAIALNDEILAEALVCYAQDGAAIRPAHGYPMRLVTPGMEGNLHIKWLRRLKFGDPPALARWEGGRSTGAPAGGAASGAPVHMASNSVITSPSGAMTIRPGPNRISGLAWSGHGKVLKVEISADGGRSWKTARIHGPVLPKAQTRFYLDWDWDGKPARLVSRCTDEQGHVQPDRAAFSAALGVTSGAGMRPHYNAQQTWAIDAAGRVRNVPA